MNVADEKFFEQFRVLLPAAQKYVYMNSAGCGPLPVPVVSRMNEIFETMLQEGQVNVGIHDWLKDLLEDVRSDVARFINADREEVFFVRCIAEGLNMINGMFALNEGDEILITDQENPASILPQFVLEPMLGTKTIKFHPCGSKEDIVSQFSDSISPSTKLAVLSHVLHTTGAALPVKEICASARSKGVITVLDGAQASGNTKIDVKDIGCDFYALSCHKWLCGPEGIAAVYIRRDLIEKLRIPAGGQGTQDSIDFATNTYTPKDGAKRFEYGGRHTPMYAAFSETIKFAETIGTDKIYSRNKQLHDYCRGQFEKRIPWAEIVSPEDERLRTGIFSFKIKGIDHRKLVKDIWEKNKIIIQWRTLDLITGEEGIRVSLNWFIRPEEIDALIDALCELTSPD